MTSYVITVEGVLRKSTDGSPLTEGIEFVRALIGERDSVVFLAEADDKNSEEFLDLNNIRHDIVLGGLKPSPVRAELMHHIRHQMGLPADMIIEPDPAICAELISEGFLVLGFFHPFFARAEWRPGYQPVIRPWADLVQQLQDDRRDATKNGG